MKKSSGGKAVRYNKWGYIFLIPFIVVFVVFQLVPLVNTIYNSFFENYMSGLTQVGPRFVGLDNYKALFSSGDIWVYFKNTMAIKYEIHYLPNAGGNEETRRFAHIFEQTAMTDKQMISRIARHSSLSEGDVAAVLMQLRDIIEEDLQEGRRINIPEIGYLSLSVDLDMDDLKPDNKVRAEYVSVRGIKFRPNADLLKQVKHHTHFEKSLYTSRSYPFSEDALKEKIREYLKHNRSINRKVLEAEFHIRKQTALNWLKKLEKSGFLIKEGSRNAPVYFLAEE